jgi:hypothetical protein
MAPQIKSRNKTAISPLLKKGHAHRTSKDYNRQREKQALKKELSQNLNRREDQGYSRDS